jgi:hypothetical protein
MYLKFYSQHGRTGDCYAMEGPRKGGKDSRVVKALTSRKVRRRLVVNPSAHRPLVATSKLIARATCIPAEPASDNDAVARQQAEAIAELGENQRRMGALLESLLSRRSEEPSPASSTSRAVETAPPTATSETSTNGENVQGDSGPSPDWQRIVMSLATGLVQSSLSVGATPRPLFTNSESEKPTRFSDNFQAFYAGVRSTPEDKLRTGISCLARGAREWAEYKKSS